MNFLNPTIQEIYHCFYTKNKIEGTPILKLAIALKDCRSKDLSKNLPQVYKPQVYIPQGTLRTLEELDLWTVSNRLPSHLFVILVLFLNFQIWTLKQLQLAFNLQNTTDNGSELQFNMVLIKSYKSFGSIVQLQIELSCSSSVAYYPVWALSRDAKYSQQTQFLQLK